MFMIRCIGSKRGATDCDMRSTSLYMAFTCFVGTSLALAIDAMLRNWLMALPTLLAIAGVALLLFASVNLVLETLTALRSNRLETQFYRHLNQLRHAGRRSSSST